MQELPIIDYLGVMKVKKPRKRYARDEGKLVKAILEYAGYNHAKVSLHRNNSGATSTRSGGYVKFGYPGSPDIIGVIWPTGQYVGIECKVGKNTPTPLQKDFHSRVKQMNGIIIVAYSLDDVKEVFEKIWIGSNETHRG